RTLLPFFFYQSPAPPNIYTLSLHDALPICFGRSQPGDRLALNRRVPTRRESTKNLDARRTGLAQRAQRCEAAILTASGRCGSGEDRKSTRLNSSHDQISYAVFCLKKKTQLRWLMQSSAACAMRPVFRREAGTIQLMARFRLPSLL